MSAPTQRRPYPLAGPWTVRRQALGHGHLLVAARRDIVATVYGGRDATPERVLAHANLIAAAPDLREQLHALLDWTYDNVAYFPDGATPTALAIAAQKAIDRADGRRETR